MPALTRTARQTVASVLFLSGGLVALAGNALHPHSPDGNAAATLTALAGDAAWPWIHLAIIVGIMLIAGGLVLLEGELTGPLAEALAPVAVAVTLVGTAVVTVSTAVDGFGKQALAQGVASAPAADATAALRAALAVDTLDLGIWSIGMLILFGAGFGLFAFAMAASRRFPIWYPGLCAAGAGLSGAAAIVQVADGAESQVAETTFLIGSMLLTLWVFVVGLRLWRGMPAPSPATAFAAGIADARP